MIARRRGVIFVHIPKCGGQSVEKLFLDDAGLTWDQRDQLLLRKRRRGERGPLRLAHLRADDYAVEYCSVEEWETFFTFGTVRDPVARAVSLYRHLALDQVMPFPQFLDDYLAPTLAAESSRWHWFMRPQADFLFDDHGRRLVDRIIPLQDLNRVLPAVLAQSCGMHHVEVPHVNAANQARRRRTAYLRLRHAAHHRTMVPLTGRFAVDLDENARERIRDLYRRDYDLIDFDTGAG